MTGRLLRKLGVTTLGALLLLSAAGAGAQERPKSIPVKQEEHLNKGLGAAPKGLDRSTPSRAWSSLLSACQGGRYGAAAHVLNLGDIKEADRATHGPVLAQRLCAVLKTTDQLTLPKLDDTNLGPLSEDGPRNYVVVLQLKYDGFKTPQEIWLRRLEDKAAAAKSPPPTPPKQPEKTDASAAPAQPPAVGVHLWVVTRKSVSLIPEWHQLVVKKKKITRKSVTQINQGLGPMPAGLKMSTPRDGATLFRELCAEGRFKDAARLLDLSSIPQKKQQSRGPKRARRLSMVLKRIHPGDFSGLSNDLAGSFEAGIPMDQEAVARTKVKGNEVLVLLARYEGLEPGSTAWLYSAATVKQIDLLYQELGYGWAGDFLPSVFFEKQIWHIQLWQWIGILLGLLIAVIGGYILSYITRKVLLKVAKLTKWEWDDAVVEAMKGPLVMAYVVVVFVALMPFLALADGPKKFFHTSGKLVVIIAVGWFLVRLTNVAGDLIMNFFKERGDDMGVAMVPVARKIVKTFIIAIVVIMGLQNLGVNVSGLLATLGIGGLAMAMAAKSTLENLIAGITIAFDRPFKVGDFISVGGISGSVEDLGLRSTRVRTGERTIVTIPNSKIVDDKVENYARRDRMRILTKLGLQYDTTPEQVLFVVDECKRYLLGRDDLAEGFRVRFVGYGDSTLDVEVLCYVLLTDFTKFTGVREQILLDLGAIVARAGAEFAYPSQTLYLGKDSHADPDKAAAAAGEVDKRRAAGDLWIPDIPDSAKPQLPAKDKDGS